MQKIIFLFLSVAIILPIATAYNCTVLNGESEKACYYIEKQDWPQYEKDSIIHDIVDKKGTLDGDFVSITVKPIENKIQLNKIDDIGPPINEENKKFLIDFSSISFLGYVIYCFIKKYYLLLKFL